MTYSCYLLPVIPCRLHFLAGCRKSRLNQALSVLCLSMFLIVLLFIRASLCIVNFRWCVFCVFVVLIKLSLLAKWLARKTPLRKPNRGKWIISTEPRPKSVYDFLGLLYCFILLLYDVFALFRGPPWYISYSYSTIWPVCAESAVKHQSTNYSQSWKDRRLSWPENTQ